MARRHFEGVEVHLPFFHVRLGEGGVHMGAGFEDDDDIIDMEMSEDAEYRAVRRSVRRRLRFLRHAFTFVAVTGFCALLDWLTGGGFWVQWLALIWGAVLAWEFVSTFITPAIWSREAEERIVQRELRRRRPNT
jgi:fatty acid desaturase